MPSTSQLRNGIDLLIIANHIQRENLLERTDLELDTLLDYDQLPVDRHTTPREARNLANAVWKGNKLVAPSGGVCILASEALKEENLLQGKPKQLARAIEESIPSDQQSQWWWD